MWLRDSLPDDLPTAQVWIYGYDSKLFNSQSMEDLGRRSGNSLQPSGYGCTFESPYPEFKTNIHQETDQRRPLIFIAHSLGGLILKEVSRSMSVAVENAG